MPDQLDAQIAAARKRAEQAKARLQALEARASQQARKQDTRRKVILGGLLIDAAEKDDRFSKVITALIARMVREQDQKAFEGWLVPSPSPEPIGVNQPPPEPPQTAE